MCTMTKMIGDIATLDQLIEVYGREIDVLDWGYKAYLFPRHKGFIGKSPRKPRMFKLEDGVLNQHTYTADRDHALLIFRRQHPEGEWERLSDEMIERERTHQKKIERHLAQIDEERASLMSWLKIGRVR